MDVLGRNQPDEAGASVRPAAKAKTEFSRQKRAAPEQSGDGEAAGVDLVALGSKCGREIFHIEVGEVAGLTEKENKDRDKLLLEGVQEKCSSGAVEPLVIPEDADLGKLPYERERVLAGMRKELESLKHFDAFEEVEPTDSRLKQGRVVGSRWVLTDKGDPECIKARLVAQEINWGDAMDGTFSATPSHSAIRTTLLIASLHQYDAVICDVQTAFLHASIDEEQGHFFIRPPQPLRRGNRLWLLKRALYGLRRSPALFQKFLGETLSGLGFVGSKADACVYYHKNGTVICAHVDDLLAVGPPKFLDDFLAHLAQQVSLKVVGRISETSWIRFLGKEYKREGAGFCVRVPQPYLDSLFEACGLESGKAVKTPGTNNPTTQSLDTPLSGADYSRFRAVLGKVLWLSHDRPDVCFAIKEVARFQTQPTEQTWQQLKRCVRYLRTSREQTLKPGLSTAKFLDAYTDSNWASAGLRSTSCGVIMVGSFPLVFYSRTQATVALSSGEAELIALTLAVQEAKGVQSLLSELGLPLHIRAHSDSSAALGCCNRKGLGRAKHLALRDLWVQVEVQEKRLSLLKIPGSSNPADLGTKFLSATDHEKCCGMLGLRQTQDDAVSAQRATGRTLTSW
jgi:uncharacterized membrane protein